MLKYDQVDYSVKWLIFFLSQYHGNFEKHFYSCQVVAPEYLSVVYLLISWRVRVTFFSLSTTMQY